ncbi:MULTISPECIES: OmpA family protein [Paracoccus]|jgi:outer membrane protein OmpA-like peptidoglycan-associated protein|uniref:OmpA family protein n=1 Tax=Paracoccus TaxID=265 RepID=UPI0025861BA5|nr:OmpA family protein [Paracoccus sp. (in: a-proteobacteria)]
MRRIYKTTTAIVTSLSLIAPQLAVAQDQQAPDTGEQVILPQDQPGQPETEQAQEPQSAPEPAPAEAEAEAEFQAEPESPGEPQPQADAPEAAEPPSDQPQEGGQPSDEQQEPQPRSEAAPEEQETSPPAAKPEVTQAEEPQAKPPVVEAAEPPAKPQAAQPDQAADQDGLPAPKPDTPDAVTTADPAPAQKPQADAADPQGSRPAAQPEAAPDAETQATTETTPAEPRPEQSDEPPTAAPDAQQDDAAQQAPGAEPPQPAEQQADDAPATETPDAQELERRLQEQSQEAAPQPDQSDEQRAEDGQRPDAQELEGRLPEQADGQAQPEAEQATEVQAPEVQAQPNAVAQRAAEEAAPAAAAALSAGEEQEDGQGELNEVQITDENARSSAEEFATSVAQGLQQQQPAEAPQEEARRDDGDDTVKDIAKLLLAGAAGMAVGKMLSNDRQVALNTGDRVVVTLPDGSQQVIKDDNTLLYRPGSNVRTETFDDGSTRTTVLREDGSRVVTIRDANMNILRRTLMRADGTETRLIDDTEAQPVQISTLPAPPPVRINRERLDEAALREALRREAAIDRRFSLGQIRNIPEVRALVAPVNVPEITFDTGSSAITPDQAQELATLGKVIRDSIDQDPREIYMIEGYTDAVGSDAANLALSDRRAESVALALTEYFQVPPENMVVQGYGEQFLLVPTDGPERQNRRVAVRRITDLLAQN